MLQIFSVFTVAALFNIQLSRAVLDQTTAPVVVLANDISLTILPNEEKSYLNRCWDKPLGYINLWTANNNDSIGFAKNSSQHDNLPLNTTWNCGQVRSMFSEGTEENYSNCTFVYYFDFYVKPSKNRRSVLWSKEKGQSLIFKFAEGLFSNADKDDAAISELEKTPIPEKFQRLITKWSSEEQANTERSVEQTRSAIVAPNSTSSRSNSSETVAMLIKTISSWLPSTTIETEIGDMGEKDQPQPSEDTTDSITAFQRVPTTDVSTVQSSGDAGSEETEAWSTTHTGDKSMVKPTHKDDVIEGYSATQMTPADHDSATHTPLASTARLLPLWLTLTSVFGLVVGAVFGMLVCRRKCKCEKCCEQGSESENSEKSTVLKSAIIKSTKSVTMKTPVTLSNITDNVKSRIEHRSGSIYDHRFMRESKSAATSLSKPLGPQDQ